MVPNGKVPIKILVSDDSVMVSTNSTTASSLTRKQQDNDNAVFSSLLSAVMEELFPYMPMVNFEEHFCIDKVFAISFFGR